MEFVDIHSHILPGVDDGSPDLETSLAMLDLAYDAGTRVLCCTPHFSPYHFGDTFDSAGDAFERFRAEAKARHPDMELHLAAELGFYDSCFESLKSGHCRLLAGRYLLVDFPEEVSFYELSVGLNKLQAMGFRLLLAHAERYRCLEKHFDYLFDFADAGGLITVNASSVTGGWGRHAQKQWQKIFKEGLVFCVASDGHNTTTRPPVLTPCVDYIRKKTDESVVRLLLHDNPLRLFEKG